MIADRLDNDITGFRRVEADAFLPKEIPDFLSRMVVLVAIARRTDGDARFKVPEQLFGGEAVVGAVMGEDHYVRLATEDAAAPKPRADMLGLDIAEAEHVKAPTAKMLNRGIVVGAGSIDVKRVMEYIVESQ